MRVSLVLASLSLNLKAYNFSRNDNLISVHNMPSGRLLLDDPPVHNVPSGRLLLEEPPRPKMHTYYEKAKTDMTNEADADLLENWKKAWWDAGWEPLIITQQDAMLLPEYDEMIDLIVDPDFIGEYNMQCYIRYMAMSAVGGGWMSDYDTFPLNHFLYHGRDLPYNGMFTVYNGFVPSLVSGNKREYFRIAKRIGESIHKAVYRQKYINKNSEKEHYKNKVPWSDMMALKDLYEKVSDDMYIQRFQVLGGEKALLVGHDFLPEDCEMTKDMRAIHFSHRAITEGKQVYRGAIHRGTIARKFLIMWHANCPISQVPNT